MSATMEGGRRPRRWKEALETPALGPPQGSSPLSTFPLNPPGKEQEEGTGLQGRRERVKEEGWGGKGEPSGRFGEWPMGQTPSPGTNVARGCASS